MALPVRILLLTLLAGALATGCGGGGESFERVTTPSLSDVSAAPRPEGDADLVVGGRITRHNAGRTVALAVDTLERLGTVRYTVRDPWLKRDVTYEGVLLSDLVAAAKPSASATKVVVTGLDEYAASISLEDVRRWPILVATRSDGRKMAVSEGGPTRIVFPYSSHDIDPAEHDDEWVWSIATVDLR